VSTHPDIDFLLSRKSNPFSKLIAFMLFMETIRVSSANAVLDAQMESANAAVRRQKKKREITCGFKRNKIDA
jgi:hypothetical protein